MNGFILATTHPSEEIWVGDLLYVILAIMSWLAAAGCTLILIITWIIKRKVDVPCIAFSIWSILFSVFPLYFMGVKHHVDYEVNIAYASEGIAQYPDPWWQELFLFYLPLVIGTGYLIYSIVATRENEGLP